MIIASIILIIVLSRAYLIYKKRNDWKTLMEIRKIYLHEFFPRHFSYYSLLSAEEKELFITRFIIIKKNLEFYSGEELLISENITTLISAAFTQITFGFDAIALEHFNKIFLHPSVFYSRWVQRDVKALTFTDGLKHWSWDEFVKGYMFSDNKIKLALHELTHAIQMECFDNDAVDTPGYKEWIAIAKVELEPNRISPEAAYLPKNVSTNLYDFFALCVEHFFNDPITFRRKLPELYNATGKVFNQDMAGRMDRVSLRAG